MAYGHSKLQTPADEQCYFPLRFHLNLKLIYNPGKLKQLYKVLQSGKLYDQEFK